MQIDRICFKCDSWCRHGSCVWSSAVNHSSSSGEVSDSESNSSSSSSDSDSSEDEVFKDGYDDDLMGDAEDRARLEQMTEKEREQELFNRIEKREVLKRRWALLIGQGKSRQKDVNICCCWWSEAVRFDRFEIKKKLKTAKKKEKEEKKRKQEEEQEKRKLSQVQDMQVVSVRMFKDGWTVEDVHWVSSWRGLTRFMRCLPFLLPGHVAQQGTTVQAWWKTGQEIPGHGGAEGRAREKEEQNRLVCFPPVFDGLHAETLTSLVCGEQQNCWPNGSRSKPARFTLTMRRKRRTTTTSPRSKATGVPVRPRLMTTSKFLLVTSQIFIFFFIDPAMFVLAPAEKKKRRQSRNPSPYQRSSTESVCPDTSWNAGATCPSSLRLWPAASWG